MSEILRWLIDDEQVDATELLKVKLNKKPQEKKPERVTLFEGIDRGVYCSQCNKMVTGFTCSQDADCPW